MRQARQRIARVQRHIGTPGLEYRQHGERHVQGALQAQADAHVRADAQCAQFMGQAIGPGIQFAIIEAVGAATHGHGPGGATHLGLEQLMHATIAVEGPFGTVPVQHQAVALLAIQQLQLRHRPLRVHQHADQYPAQVTGETRHGRRIEQRAGVFQAAADHAILLGQDQGQVELGRLMTAAQWPGFQPAQSQRARLGVFPGEHHLEQRTVGLAAGRVELLHHLFERQFLMFLGAEGHRATVFQQLAHRRRIGHRQAQHQGIDEEADQVLGLPARAVGGRRADQHLVLSGETCQHHGPAGQQRHEQRAAMTQAQGLELCGQGGVQHQRFETALIRLQCRAWPVGGQFQQGGCPGQGVAPVGAVVGLGALGEPAALPFGVVGVLQGRGRQRIVEVLAEGVVQCPQFPGQDRHRPAIADDVVQGQQQHVFLLADHQQAPAKQRPLLQIERRIRLFTSQCRDPGPGLGMAGEFVDLPVETPSGLGDHLHHLVIVGGEGGAQRFVTGHQPIQRPLQCRAVQGTPQLQAEGDVIGVAATGQLGEKPQPALREGRRRRHARALHRGDFRTFVQGGELRRRHFTQRGLVEH